MAIEHATSAQVLSLRPLQADLAARRSRAIVKTGALEVMHVILLAGKSLPVHQVAGELTLHCLEGRVALTLDDGDRTLSHGDWVYLAGGTAHGVAAVEDSALLLTVLLQRHAGP